MQLKVENHYSSATKDFTSTAKVLRAMPTLSLNNRVRFLSCKLSQAWMGLLGRNRNPQIFIELCNPGDWNAASDS